MYSLTIQNNLKGQPGEYNELMDHVQFNDTFNIDGIPDSQLYRTGDSSGTAFSE